MSRPDDALFMRDDVFLAGTSRSGRSGGHHPIATIRPAGQFMATSNHLAGMSISRGPATPLMEGSPQSRERRKVGADGGNVDFDV